MVADLCANGPLRFAWGPLSRLWNDNTHKVDAKFWGDLFFWVYQRREPVSPRDDDIRRQTPPQACAPVPHVTPVDLVARCHSFRFFAPFPLEVTLPFGRVFMSTDSDSDNPGVIRAYIHVSAMTDDHHRGVKKAYTRYVVFFIAYLPKNTYVMRVGGWLVVHRG
jgi:hypothetical protein